nr:MAG TPA: hypothetical protein [Caudoviricetes sp.]
MMTWKDASSATKGELLFYAGVTLIAAAAAIFSVAFFVLAILFAPWPTKALSTLMLAAISLMGVGAYMGDR